VAAVDVIILHPLAAENAGPLERGLADARIRLAQRHRHGFLQAGADSARIVAGEPDGRPFGERVADLLADHLVGRGMVLLGSGAMALATVGDRRAFVATARTKGEAALANNRFSADAVALSGPAVAALRGLPRSLPSDNALPRWLEEVAGVKVDDLRTRWRLGVDLDSPLDVLLVERSRTTDRGRTVAAGGPTVAGGSAGAGLTPVEQRLDRIRRVMADPSAELVVAGRTSAASLAWLERTTRCRVRALIEERGLRAASGAARRPTDGSDVRTARPPRSVLGLVLDRDGPRALGHRLAELGDAALVDSRVLLAHRLGVDEAGWPAAESRFASDLLDPASVDDPWLAALTSSAADAPIPIVLGGHTLVGPGARLVAGGH